MAEIVEKINAERDAMSPEARAELETTERFRNQKADEELLAAMSPEERQRVLDAREGLRDRLRVARTDKAPIELPRNPGLELTFPRTPAEVLGAEAALEALRKRSYRRPKPRADGL
jgi:hypothetical protein